MNELITKAFIQSNSGFPEHALDTLLEIYNSDKYKSERQKIENVIIDIFRNSYHGIALIDIPYIKKCAENGIGEFQYLMGVRESENYIRWYKRALKNGKRKESAIDLAKLYMGKGSKMGNGKGERGFSNPKKNLKKAIYYYRIAADEGSVYAMYKLGKHYFEKKAEKDRYKKENEKKALYWYSKAADNNNLDAIYAMGRIYKEGLCGVEIDYEKALEYFKRDPRDASHYEFVVTSGLLERSKKSKE